MPMKTTSMLLVLGLVVAAPLSAEDKDMAHTHMEHLTSNWSDTPDQRGLLPTALSEAQTAAQHADLAAKKPNDLEWMKLHIGHVLHAVDPSVEAQGPGQGYGIKKASAGVAKHVELAAGSPGASDSVKLHAKHIATSANNTVARADRIVSLGQQVMEAQNAQQAAPLVREVQAISGTLISGQDTNDDGDVGWHEGEGGLRAVERHVGLMAEGEEGHHH
jgi:hypothetical protein